MGKIVALEYVTLDGVMQAPGGAEEFEYSGWTMPYWHEEIGKFQFSQLFASGALLLGRVTYQGFAAAWPSMKDEWGFADRMNNLPKYVVSTTLSEVAWNNSRLIKDDIAAEISRLKQEVEQDILIYGSGNLIETLMDHDLIDEYQLLVYPVVLGSGARLFRDRSDKKVLKLVEAKALGPDVVALIYQPEPKA